MADDWDTGFSATTAQTANTDVNNNMNKTVSILLQLYITKKKSVSE